MTWLVFQKEDWPDQEFLIRSRLQFVGNREHRVDIVRGGKFVIYDGIYSLFYGQKSVASLCFEKGLKWLEGDEDRYGPLVFTDPTLRVLDESEIPDEIKLPGLVHHGVEVVNAGWDAFDEVSRWECIAIGRWLHEGVHDRVAFENAAAWDALHCVAHPEEIDAYTIGPTLARFAFAQRDDLMDQYIDRPRRFKPPARPSSIRSEKAIAWVLSENRRHGLWDDKQIDSALRSMLRAKVNGWFDHGGDLSIALWTKHAFWDRVPEADRPPPHEALRRCFDFVDIEPLPMVIEE